MTDLASQFRQLHAGLAILCLPNAWDVGSARLFESLGARAIALSSAGVAWSLGYPDGDALPVDLHLAVVAAVTAAVSVPVSVDIEDGYADDPAQVGDHVASFVAAGAVGINIEDGTGNPDLLAAKIDASRRPGLFINARTDVSLRGLSPGTEHAETLRRAALYAAAGADCIFVPGVTDRDAISALARAIIAAHGLPLNVLARAGLPDARTLEGLGVLRLSAGSAITQAVYGLARRLAADFVAGDSSALFSGAMPYPEINALMTQP
ncbi:MAG: isocitrate lyase/PEP mutase family protein [Polymorphobacter sp.]